MKTVLFNSHDLVLVVIVYLCTLFAILLFSLQSQHRRSSALLGVFLLSQAVIALDILFRYGDALHQWALAELPGAALVFGTGYWLEGPLLLWYTRSVMYSNYRLRWLDVLYLLPAALYLISVVLPLVLFGEQGRDAFVDATQSLMRSAEYHYLYLYPRDVTRLVFFLFCAWEILRYRKALREGYSSIGQLDYTWLMILVLGFTLLRAWGLLVSLLFEFFGGTQGPFNFDFLGLITNYAELCIVSVLLFYSLSHSAVLEGVEKESLKQLGDSRRAQAGLNITDEQVQRVLNHMSERRPYLDSNLKIDELAKQVSLPVKTLSAIINRHFDKNFFEFVNQYRIEEACRQLQDETLASKTIMAIMVDSGFNGKATFNSLFKREKGMTPSQFRQNATYVSGEYE